MIVSGKEHPITKTYDHYEAKEIISIAIVKKNQIKHSQSSLEKLYEHSTGHELKNSKTYMAICISGKDKKTGAKKYTFYGLLPKKEDIKGTYYSFVFISVSPGCYEYKGMNNKKIPISMGSYPSTRIEQQEFRFQSDMYGKNILYIISLYSGPSYSTRINYLYYPMMLGAFVIDIVTAPLQLIAAFLLKDVRNISP